MAWQLEGEDKILAWSDTSPDAVLQGRVLTWIARLVDDPLAIEGIPVAGERLDVQAANVPGTDVWITWLVVEQYRVVRIKEVVEL